MWCLKIGFIRCSCNCNKILLLRERVRGVIEFCRGKPDLLKPLFCNHYRYKYMSLNNHMIQTTEAMRFLPRRNKYDNTMEYWCDTGMLGERIHSETITESTTVSRDGETDSLPTISDEWKLGKLLDEKELISEEQAKLAQPKARQSTLPKLEEQQKA